PESHARARELTAADLHRARVRVLQAVRREVEEHAAQCTRVADAAVYLRQHELQLEPLLFRHWRHDVPHAVHHFGDRERYRLAIDKALAATNDVDEVTGESAEPQSGAVDETELPLLNLGYRAATRR